MNKIVLIDGNSLLFRAYFAMRDMVTASGIHTQGVFAFINMLNRIVLDHDPDYMAVAFDMKEKTFRHELYPEYKAGRLKTPIELLQQIPLMHDVLKAMNIAVVELPKYEADDIIGTIAADCSSKGLEVLVITGDKDELQLIDERTRVLINKKGVTDFEIYDTDKMKERYGITPKQFIDLKGLMGDKSDNIPGVPGIGEKKGVALIRQYGSLESVIEHADEVKGKMGETLRENLDAARMSKELATICVDAPIEYSIDDLAFTEPDMEALIAIYKKLEFNGFINKLRSTDAEAAGRLSAESTLSEMADSVTCCDMSEFLEKVASGSSVYIEADSDDSHLAVPEIASVSLYSEEKKLFSCIALTPLTADAFIGTLARRGYRMRGFDLKRIAYAFIGKGFDSPELEYDVMIAEYLIDPNMSRYQLSKMLLRYAEQTLEESSDERSMSLRRLCSCSLVHKAQSELLDSLGLRALFESCEMPLIETLAAMEAEGIRLDADVLTVTGRELDARTDELESSIHELAGQKFNINSPKQLGKVLFEDMALPYPKPSKGKAGWSTAADVLEKIYDESPIVEQVLLYRKYAKLKGTYVDGLLPLIGEDGRIHPHFQQTVAATGRLSCTEPNLQNIPVRDEYGRGIRRAFVTGGDDRLFVGADYSQIELRIMAALSGDENMIGAFNDGNDIHRITASRVFGIPYDEVTAADRSRAKAVNFGVIYGMSGFGLSENLHISRKEAQEYINDYFQKHPAVKAYLDRQIEAGERDKAVRTIFGRIRQIPEFSSRRFMDRQLAQRLAMNTPIQGSAADIIKMAMNSVYGELKERGFKSRLVLQIHDELIIEACADELEEVKELLARNMEGAADLAVKLVVDMNVADNWYDLK